MKLARYIKSMEPSTEPSLMKLAEKSMSTTVISKRNHVFLRGKKTTKEIRHCHEQHPLDVSRSTKMYSTGTKPCNAKLDEMSRFIDD